MSVLIDTSVWVAHFRQANAALIGLTEQDRALTHPMVIAEIACSTPPVRLQTLENLELLRPCHPASLCEVMAFVEREKLYGLGCGLVDLALLASTLLTPGACLWTLDKRLSNLAGHFGGSIG
jgi:predicted nucleic acid-binding protein